MYTGPSAPHDVSHGARHGRRGGARPEYDDLLDAVVLLCGDGVTGHRPARARHAPHGREGSFHNDFCSEGTTGNDNILYPIHNSGYRKLGEREDDLAEGAAPAPEVRRRRAPVVDGHGPRRRDDRHDAGVPDVVDRDGGARDDGRKYAAGQVCRQDGRPGRRASRDRPAYDEHADVSDDVEVAEVADTPDVSPGYRITLSRRQQMQQRSLCPAHWSRRHC